MSKYIIPICKINDSKVYNLVIVATSINDCKVKIMEKFNSYDDDYDQFINDMDTKDILIGDITDVETY